MLSSGPNSLQVSTQVSAIIAGIPANFSNAFTAAPASAVLTANVVTIPVGASAAPIGSLTLAQLGFLFIENQDLSNPLFVSTNADGSMPFAKIGPGQAAVIPTAPNQAYYLRVDSAPVTALVVALSS